MKKFKYRLEALLKVKEHLERERQKDHGEAVRKVMRQRDQLTDIEKKRLTTYDEQRDVLIGKMSVAEMLVYSRYLMKLKRDQLVGKQLLQALDHEAEEKRIKLVEASREKKVFEKLKERQQKKFNKEVHRLETKEDDETAVVSFRRKE